MFVLPQTRRLAVLKRRLHFTVTILNRFHPILVLYYGKRLVVRNISGLFLKLTICPNKFPSKILAICDTSIDIHIQACLQVFHWLLPFCYRGLTWFVSSCVASMSAVCVCAGWFPYSVRLLTWWSWQSKTIASVAVTCGGSVTHWWVLWSTHDVSYYVCLLVYLLAF